MKKTFRSQKGFLSLFVAFVLLLVALTGIAIYYGDTSSDVRNDLNLNVSILSNDTNYPGCNGIEGGENGPVFPVSENLWIKNSDGDVVFQPGAPGERIPLDRDSSDWTSLTQTTAAQGHEMFESLEVLGDYLYVLYNGGFIIYDIGTDPERPKKIDSLQKDIWDGSYTDGDPYPYGEDDFLAHAIDVFPIAGTSEVIIAVSGRNAVGVSFWKFNTSARTLDQIFYSNGYSGSTRSIRLVEHNGTLYAFGAKSNSVDVFDVSQALSLGSCKEDITAHGEGDRCPDVYLGNLGDIGYSAYVDVLTVEDRLYAITSQGSQASSPTEFWHVTNPSQPDNETPLAQMINQRVKGLEFFTHQGSHYLAWVKLGGSGSTNTIEVFNIDNCVQAGATTCDFTNPVWSYSDIPPYTSPQQITYSESNGIPFLHYGVNANGGQGKHYDQLFDITTLGTSEQNIREITDGGPMYPDRCADEDIGYWGWYYIGNEFGINNFVPHMGKFNNNNYFYRAALGIVDVHVFNPEAYDESTNSGNDPGQGSPGTPDVDLDETGDCLEIEADGCTFAVDDPEVQRGRPGNNNCTEWKPFCVECKPGTGWDGRNCTPSGGKSSGCAFGYEWNGERCVQVQPGSSKSGGGGQCGGDGGGTCEGDSATAPIDFSSLTGSAWTVPDT